jgi:hypothetical protein
MTPSLLFVPASKLASTAFLTPTSRTSAPAATRSLPAATLGMEAAAAILSLRLNDGSELPEPQVLPNPKNPNGVCNSGDPSCVPTNTAPGLWQIDPISGLTVALGAHWGQVKPFS